MKLSLLPSKCLISFDPDPERNPGGMIILPDGVWYPGASRQWSMRPKPKSGLCILHAFSSSWDEVNLTGKRVIVDRAAARPFKVMHEGKEHIFYIVSQWAVMAVIEEEVSGQNADHP